MAMPTQMSSMVASIWIASTAAKAAVMFAVELVVRRVISLVNIGTNTATPKGAAKSRKSPYIPVPEPAVSAGKFDRTIFIKMVAFAPSPSPRIPRELARDRMLVDGEKKSIIPQPTPVSRSEIVKMCFGSKRSAKGPKRIEPRDMPRYIIEIAYPEMTELSGWVEFTNTIVLVIFACIKPCVRKSIITGKTNARRAMKGPMRIGFFAFFSVRTSPTKVIRAKTRTGKNSVDNHPKFCPKEGTHSNRLKKAITKNAPALSKSLKGFGVKVCFEWVK